MAETIWETPSEFFEILNNEFKFTLDVCALSGTAKCSRYLTPEIDALKQDWSKEIFWMNPPYGRGQNVYKWVQKAFTETQKGGTGVCLLPASIDTKWFHEFCMKAHEIRFVKDRLWFSLNGKAQRANHASIIVIFRQTDRSTPAIKTITNGRKLSRR